MFTIKNLEGKFYSWKNRKIVGNIMLILSGVICLELGYYLLTSKSPLHEKALDFIAFFWLYLTYYNWLLGRQKGHFFHFFGTISTFLNSVVVLISQEIGLLYVFLLALIVVCIVSLRSRYFADFQADFESGISRDYFRY